jgi:hypothetical protein
MQDLTTADLYAFHKAASITQAEMAEAMGLPLRTYEDIITGKVAFRKVHQRAAEMAMIRVAFQMQDCRPLPEYLADLVFNLGSGSY